MLIPTSTPLKDPPADYCPPQSERWFTIPEGLDAGKQLFYYDHQSSPGRPAKKTVLFVHGNPECSYTYRGIRDALLASSEPVRLVAVDHIGFGLSDQADFEMVDIHHAANVIQLVRHLDLCDLTLVVHDWGGPIGIGALLEDPDRVSGLLAMNTTVFPMPSDGHTYTNFPFPWLPWFLTPRLVPDRAWGGLAAAVVCHAHPQTTLPFLRATARWTLAHTRRSIARDRPEYVFSQTLRGRANVRSSKRQVRQTPVWGHGYRYTDPRHGVQDNHAFYARIQATITDAWGPAGRNIPACGYFGEWDACGKASVVAQWHRALPQMRSDTHCFADVGHFIEEYKGPETAASILAMQPQA